jgi:hypothetical protein
VCQAGVCQPATARTPQCLNNSGCSAGQECVNAQCKSVCYTDSDCGTCGAGNTVCVMGYCSN